MSIERACYVSCDECGTAGPVDVFDGAAGARSQARDVGFQRLRVNGVLKDLCLGCRQRLGL